MKNLIYYYKKAIKNGFAIGAFNFQNLEGLKAICSAAEETKSPVIVAASEGTLKYMGEEYLAEVVKVAKKCYHAPIFLHLDHGKSFDVCKKAINLGFDSVMIDASALEFEENVALTKKVADYAHKKGVFVEGELGKLTNSSEHFTDADEAALFIQKTHVDSLAVAIGTSHGAYKFEGTPKLRFDILSQIEKLAPDFPLVLHGASSVNQKTVKMINKYGGELGSPKGVSEKLLREAITKHNIVKINIDTDLRMALTAGIRKSLKDNPKNFDPREYFKEGQALVKDVVKSKIINILNSAGQA